MVKTDHTSHDPNPTNPRRGWKATEERGRVLSVWCCTTHTSSFVLSFFILTSFLPFSLSRSVHLILSLEGRSHGSLLCEFLGVQGFGEGRGLIGVGGYYGGTVGDGIRCSSGVAGGGLQVLPCEQVCVAAG